MITNINIITNLRKWLAVMGANIAVSVKVLETKELFNKYLLYKYYWPQIIVC